MCPGNYNKPCCHTNNRPRAEIHQSRDKQTDKYSFSLRIKLAIYWSTLWIVERKKNASENVSNGQNLAGNFIIMSFWPKPSDSGPANMTCILILPPPPPQHPGLWKILDPFDRCWLSRVAHISRPAGSSKGPLGRCARALWGADVTQVIRGHQRHSGAPGRPR